jgi:hypothetical protein
MAAKTIAGIKIEEVRLLLGNNVEGKANHLDGRVMIEATGRLPGGDMGDPSFLRHVQIQMETDTAMNLLAVLDELRDKLGLPFPSDRRSPVTRQ